MGPVNVIQYGHGHKQWKPKYNTEREKIINKQYKKNYTRTGMLCDNKLRPLNSGPYLPMLSEGVSNWYDLPISGTDCDSKR